MYSKLPKAGDETGRESSPPTAVLGPSEQGSRLQVLLLGWASLMLAILSGAAIGPAFKWMEIHHVSELLAASWRCQAMVLTLIPMAFIETYFYPPWGWLTWKKREGLQFPLYVYIAIAGLAWSVNLSAWVIGLQYTTTVRASIFAGSHPLLLVLYYHFKGDKVTIWEWSGVFVSFFGLLFIALFGDGLFMEIFKGTTSYSRKGVAEPTGREVFGDLICLISACAEVVVIVNRHHTRQLVAPLQYTFLTTCIVATVTTVLAALCSSSPSSVVFSLQEGGIFGWLAPKWFTTMLIFGLVVGVVCVSGFNLAMNYIAPLVFSCVLLVDPAVTGVISWLMGLEAVPDAFTILGGVIVVGGVALVTYGEHLKEEKKKAEVENRSFEMVSLQEEEEEIWNHSLDDSDEDDELGQRRGDRERMPS